MIENKLGTLKQPAAGTIEAGNDIYRVFIQDIPGQAVGVYTATTGPIHPLGPGRNLLFGGGAPGTTFNTFRSYTTMTDYTVDGISLANPPFTKVNIRPFGTTVPLGSTGARTTYVLPGPPVTPDSLTIIQDVDVIGTSFANSYILVRVEIINHNNVDTKIGIRYLWDPIIDADDGPTFQTVNPIGPLLTNETEFEQPDFEAFQLADNDNNPHPPTYITYGSVAGPQNLGLGTPPTMVKYVSWAASRVTTFDYAINPNRVVSSPPINDSAALYYWGHDMETAINLEACGGKVTRAAALLATKPGIVPPFINNTICVNVNRVLDTCRQEGTQTFVQSIPSLSCGTLLGCKVKKAKCLARKETDNTVNVHVIFKVAYKIKISGNVTTVVKTFTMNTTTNLHVPDKADVICEVQNPRCESRQLECNLVETTISAFIKLQSQAKDSIVIPYVASCPVGLCPTITIENVEQDSKLNDESDETI